MRFKGQKIEVCKERYAAAGVSRIHHDESHKISIGELAEISTKYTERVTVREFGTVTHPKGNFRNTLHVQGSLTFSFQTIYLDSLDTSFYTPCCTSGGIRNHGL